MTPEQSGNVSHAPIDVVNHLRHRLWARTPPIVFPTRLMFATSLWVADRRPFYQSLWLIPPLSVTLERSSVRDAVDVMASLMRQGRCARWNQPILEILTTIIV
jgi:hypothetical protein